jgi:multiple sugar transport system permease protein
MSEEAMTTLATASATTAAPRRRARRHGRGQGGIGHTIVGVLILAVFLFPVYWMLNVSLQHSSGAVATPWLPTDVSLHGYSKALHDQGGHLLTSLEIALGTVAFSLLVAAPAAYALAHFRVRGANVVLLVILISQMIPGIVVANALYSAYSDLGLLNSVWGLILADSTLGIPFAMLILRAFMVTLPRSIMEAALVDGAGPVRVFVSVVLPLCRNAIITAALFSFLFAWGDFLFALTLTTTEDVRPVTLGLYTYIGAFVADWSSVMATAMMASLPAVVLLVVAQRYVAAGTTAGAVK